ncbi:MAG: 1-acyl-sn-glycerol-3-phosphate acyltransferase, partial [Clostridia bacterium]|nr:1-acyl-sn-glycerol-3-phosphate acyltransferase [Clostridia bacterium]
KKQKKEKWVKFRHRIITAVLRVLLRPYVVLKYGIECVKFKEQGDRQYLILLNHQTPFDQFFVALSFKRPIYYMATEDIFSKGFVSSIIRYLVAPIPIKKQTSDVAAVLNCLRVAREGGTICIAPEGNRTYSGKTEYINPTIASLAKRLRLPIALYRIEGGYGVQPRWSDVVRNGKMRAYVSEVIEPEDLKAMTDDELNERIVNGLFVDEAYTDGIYRHKERAQYLERAIYVCPFCKLAEFESNGDIVTCKRCGRSVRYGETKELSGIGFDFPFTYVSQWYEYQKELVNQLDLTAMTDEAIFEDVANFSQVIVNKKKLTLRENAQIKLYGNRITIDEDGNEPLTFLFDELTAVSVLGRNKLNIYQAATVYQFKGGKRFNALKYVNFYYRYNNIAKGEEDGQFLGL